MSRASNPVELTLLANRLEAITRQMMNTVFRTARSGVVNTGRDFSCCIITGNHELVAGADSLPMHIMGGPDLISQALLEFHPVVVAGDAYLHNSPYHGNSHPADLCVVVPVVDENGIHRFTVMVKTHQADIGNAAPTTYFAAARDVYEEGALIFPMVQVQRDYLNCDDVMRMCRVRIRVPDQWEGDYLASLGGARIGERRLLELGAEMGWNRLDALIAEWLNYSERLMSAAIQGLPRTDLTIEGAHDPFPGVPDGVSLRARLRISPADRTITVDLRDNPDCQPCGLNLTEATATASARIGVFGSLPDSLPLNAGSFRRIKILLRENCIAGIPRHPASCAVATTNVAHRIVNLVFRGMARAMHGLGRGEGGLIATPALAMISGIDHRAGDVPFVNQVILMAAGDGARPERDGWLHVTVGGGGVVLRDSVELDELRFPIVIDTCRIVPDSEGAGSSVGGRSVRVSYGPTDRPIHVMFASDGVVNPAQGVRGGDDGRPASQHIETATGSVLPVPVCGRVLLEPGDRIVAETCSGGGYGSPLERDVAHVRKDVLDGRLSVRRALQVYGVAITEDGRIDEDATATRRRALRSATRALRQARRTRVSRDHRNIGDNAERLRKLKQEERPNFKEGYISHAYE